MTTPDPTIASRPSFATAPRWVRWLLPASLALNVLILGIVAGGLWRLREAAAAQSIGPSMLAYSQTLPTERREGVRRAFADQRATIRPLRKAAQAARRELRQAMLAEPYDRARVLAAHEAVVAAEARLRNAVGAVVATAAGQLSREERRQFLNSWRAGPRRGFGGGGQLDGADGDDGEPRPGPGPRRP